MSESVRGSHASRRHRASKTYGTGRRCAEDGCDARLSTYNRLEYCYQHWPFKPARNRGRTTK